MKSLPVLINESKKYLKENNLPIDYLSKYITKKYNLNESEVRKQVSEYFLNKFLKSNSTSFNKFIEEELEQEIEEDGMTMASIPVESRPERPIEERKNNFSY